MSTALTEAKIRGLTSGEYADGRVPGLSLRIETSGAATWRLAYVGPAGGRRKVKVGVHSRNADGRRTPIVGVEEARKLAETLRIQIAGGADPWRERRSARTSKVPTLADAFDHYLREHITKRATATTLATTRTVARVHILPSLGKFELRYLDRFTVASWHSKIGADAPAGQGKRAIANRALTIVRASFEHAARAGWIDASTPNPCTRIRPFPERVRHRDAVLNADARARLLAELREAPTRPWEGRLSQGVADALILLTLTGCRRTEILGLRWREVDLERGELRLETTKSGASTRPIGPAAIEAITTIRSRRYGHAQAPREALVCPSETGSQIDGHNLDRAWRQVRARLGLTMRLHDLRHSAATSILEAGGRLEDAAAALGHRTLRMAQRYAHPGHDRAREVLARVDAATAQGRAMYLVDGGAEGEANARNGGR